MATAPNHEAETVDRRFEIVDLTGCDWHLRVRSGLPFELRRWGAGHWCVADGEPHFFASREAAEEAGAQWVETGRAA